MRRSRNHVFLPVAEQYWGGRRKGALHPDFLERERKDLGFVEVEIFNNGKSPNLEDMDNLFVPFYSSKPYGTGFGLPIAQLAAKKNMGELYLEKTGA